VVNRAFVLDVRIEAANHCSNHFFLIFGVTLSWPSGKEKLAQAGRPVNAPFGAANFADLRLLDTL
jgi:hypothetical protein